ncbi:MAG: cytochrome c maturation protein CcmE [Rhizobacter sp.]|nr:cytochrome c maturation protein CcmE [Chlorobiales bacterium]
MTLKPKFIVGFVVIASVLAWLGFTAQEWGNNVIGYADFHTAGATKKLCYVKGYWVKEKETGTNLNTFSFYMRDDKGEEVRVLYRNGKPNNFEQATSVVVQGTLEGDTFYAKDILVKCPSKYQSEKADTKKV